MPSRLGAPAADLSSSLDATLLRDLGWLVLAGLVAAGAMWWSGRRPTRGSGSRRADLLGLRVTELPAEPAGRRYLRVAFGLLWISDGLLQAQPQMAAGFGRDVLTPALATGPDWLANAAGPIVRVFARHPVAADAATVWIQIGLGVLLILGGTGILSRLAIWSASAWSIVVWVVGEGMGGLFSPGAGWLVGAPGAVLVYFVAAVLLLLPWSAWDGDRLPLLVRRVVAAWIAVGAALQLLPWEGFWSATGAAAPFDAGAAHQQPALLRRPIVAASDAAGSHPVIVNAIVVTVLLVIALGLAFSRATGWVTAGLLLCMATWWVAQDFGVLGGMATDPSTALPLGLLLVCALPVWPDSAARPTPSAQESRTGLAGLREPVAAGTAALGLGALFVAPLVTAALVLGPAGSSAVAADGGGGVVTVAHRPAPPFDLTDQKGRQISSATLTGKLTVLTFLDPVCSDECPLIADQLARADRALGPLASRVEIVAIDSNPLFTGLTDVAAFTSAHGLDDLANWHFLAGSAADLQQVTSSYGIAVQVPSVGMIEHGEGIYFVGTDGTTLAYLGDGAAQELTQTYADVVEHEIRRLLG